MGSDYTGLVRCAGAGGCCWSGVREKHYWLAGGWRLLLEWCERKILLAGWRLLEQNRVTDDILFCQGNFGMQKIQEFCSSMELLQNY